MNRGTLFRYSFLALGLGWVALPLYVYLPKRYADLGLISLSAIGLILLAARLLEALLDPMLGRWLQVLQTKPFYKKVLIAAVLVMSGAVFALLNPLPSAASTLGAWLLGFGWLAYMLFSALTIHHQSQGSLLAASRNASGGAPPVFEWREAFTLGGVLVGSVLPAFFNWSAYALVLSACLLLGLFFSLGFVQNQSAAVTSEESNFFAWLLPRKSLQRLLLGVFISSLAGSLPASLLGFYLASVLQLGGQEPYFLGFYFAAAALAYPLWAWLLKRLKAQTIWVAAIALASLIFALCLLIAPGAWAKAAFTVVSIGTGALLGAELVMPSIVITQLLQKTNDLAAAPRAYGAVIASQKLALAVGAGVGLILADGASLLLLTLLYCLVPCGLKLCAALILRKPL